MSYNVTNVPSIGSDVTIECKYIDKELWLVTSDGWKITEIYSSTIKCLREELIHLPERFVNIGYKQGLTAIANFLAVRVDTEFLKYKVCNLTNIFEDRKAAALYHTVVHYKEDNKDELCHTLAEFFTFCRDYGYKQAKEEFKNFLNT